MPHTYNSISRRKRRRKGSVSFRKIWNKLGNREVKNHNGKRAGDSYDKER